MVLRSSFTYCVEVCSYVADHHVQNLEVSAAECFGAVFVEVHY